MSLIVFALACVCLALGVRFGFAGLPAFLAGIILFFVALFVVGST